MNRRGYLKSVAATLAVFLGRNARANLAGPADGYSVEGRALALKLERLFSNPDSARVVGLQYLASYPGLASGALDRVRKLVDTSNGRGAKFTLKEQLVRQRREDFATGESVIIDGWVIARSEADICGSLVCLTRGH